MANLASSSRGMSLSSLRQSLPSPSSSSSSASSGSSSMASRSFSTTSCLSAKPRRTRTRNDPLALNRMKAYNYDDVPTQGHLIIQRQRELLKYYRIATTEMPKLQQFRQAYVPPSPSSFVRYRFLHYQGEDHPATRKVVLTVPVAPLFNSGALKTDAAKHKFLLLAGNRYDSKAGHVAPLPKQALDTLAEKDQQKANGLTKGVEEQKERNHLGQVKISAEHLPNEAQNMKWCADRLDDMIREANKDPQSFSSLPLDRRHELVKEAKRGGFERRRAASIRDFPAEWL